MSPGDDRTVRADELLSRLRQATLGEFEILSEAGRGGMAVVYLAHDISLDRKVAIKVISPNILWMGEGIAERFKREARVSASLSHPHIIPIYAVKESEDLLFFIMKYVPGRTLEEVIAEVGPLPPAMVHTILTQVGGALGYAHRQGVVHRDIKPANVMLDQEGWAVITDFGIAKVATGEGLTQTGSAVGTPAYMSPEQCSGLSVTGASDQYALGVVAYEMVAGRKPFDASTAMALMYKHVHAKPEPLKRWAPECPPAISQAIMRALEKTPDDRWPQMEDMVAALGSVPHTDTQQVRTQMLELAKASSAQAIVEKFRTPQSPVPTSRSRAPRKGSQPGTPPPTDGEEEPFREPATTPAPSSTLSIPVPAPRTVALAAIPLVAIAVIALWAPWNGRAPTAPPGGGEPDAPLPVPVAAAALEVFPVERALAVGETLVLRLGAWDDGGAEVDVGHVDWISSDPAVASVSATGLVTALGPGTVEISAAAGGLDARTRITVDGPLIPAPAAGEAVARIEIAPSSGSLRVGETLRLQASTLDEGGRAVTGRSVAWSSSDDRVARVSPTGIVSGVGPGSARITASSQGRSQTATVTVAAAPVVETPVAPASAASVEVSPSIRTLRPGEAFRFQASVRDQAGGTVSGADVRWSSSDERVAAVTPGGEVRGVGPGSARVTATSGGVTGSADVTVEAAAEPAPPPEERADPAVEIADLVDGYARALQARDLAGARRLYPAMTSGEEETWASFFGIARELSVTMRLTDVTLAGDRAAGEVRMTLAYRVQRREEDTSTIHMTFGREAGTWRILEIR